MNPVSTAGFEAPPSSWLVLPEERQIRILVALDSQIYLVDAVQAVLQVHGMLVPGKMNLHVCRFCERSACLGCVCRYLVQCPVFKPVNLILEQSHCASLQ